MKRPLFLALVAAASLSACGRHARPARAPVALRPAPAAMTTLRVFVDTRKAAASEKSENAPQAHCLPEFNGPLCPPAGAQNALAGAIAAALVQAGIVVVTDPTVDYDVHLTSELYVTYRGACRAQSPSALTPDDREQAYCGIVLLDNLGALSTRESDRAHATVVEGALTHLAEGRACGTSHGVGWPSWHFPIEHDKTFDARRMALDVANAMTDCDGLVSFAKEVTASTPLAPAAQPQPPVAPPARPAPPPQLPAVAPTQT
ncbi:MAG TPA: hypothetical protein VLT33_24345 [Labilithrix sp.]|nr:hypothetical protein [Labilithrix sp.]